MDSSQKGQLFKARNICDSLFRFWCHYNMMLCDIWKNYGHVGTFRELYTDRFLYLRFFMSFPFSRIYANSGLERSNRREGEAIQVEFVCMIETSSNSILLRIRWIINRKQANSENKSATWNENGDSIIISDEFLTAQQLYWYNPNTQKYITLDASVPTVRTRSF